MPSVVTGCCKNSAAFCRKCYIGKLRHNFIRELVPITLSIEVNERQLGFSEVSEFVSLETTFSIHMPVTHFLFELWLQTQAQEDFQAY